MSTGAELRAQLDRLRKENNELRTRLKNETSKCHQIVIRYAFGSNRGHPVVRFEGVGRPFCIGLKKASVILACRQELEEFVNVNNAALAGYVIEKGLIGAFDSARDDTQI